MIKKEDIKVGLKFVASCDKLFYTDLNSKEIHVFTVKGFEIRDNEVYILTDCAYSFTMKALLGASSRYEMFYPYEVSANESANRNANESANRNANESANRKSDADHFKEITDKMSDTYKRKNHDYGNAFSEMYNELGINYGYGKIREKVNRIKTLKDNEAQVANEPLEDALLDCANYCILTLMEYQKRKEHGTD